MLPKADTRADVEHALHLDLVVLGERKDELREVVVFDVKNPDKPIRLLTSLIDVPPRIIACEPSQAPIMPRSLMSPPPRPSRPASFS